MGMEALFRLRREEHTGEQRCWPCTLVNILIVVGLAAALGHVSRPLAIALMAAGLVLIYLRGYLIPGTPELTRRYLPGRVLRLFGKEVTTEIAAPDDEDLAVALDLRAKRGEGDDK